MSEPAELSSPDENGVDSKPRPLVVGLGASAGGIQALSRFFEQVEPGNGIAYVVILHLSPDHDSRLAQVLQTVCVLPVTQVLKEVHVEADHVYVIPPDQHLTMWNGYIEVSPNTCLGERRAPIDIFFRTLAETRGPQAICVILSGTGANGSMGLKRIKECGGAAFVQDPNEAEWQEMPRNSIATALVDDVLPVAEIPARIVAYKEQLGRIDIPVEPDKRPEEQQQALREVFTQLRVGTGHDFSSYKRATLLRRIERRINVRSLPDLGAYAQFCQANPDETQALLKDLLISVTNFFRDPQAFEYLGEKILPRILKAKKAQDRLRIWAVGCASGEEAYSVAMLCAEHMLGTIDGPKLQIFATDIDVAAIAKAREGLYTLNDAADVSAERLRRFFVKEGENYRIRRELRESILFANHNVLRDPPFSHIDLITCRNMLIYLDYKAQERVMETLHFALNKGGYLFLGTSESVDGSSDLYMQVSREHHVFQSRALAGRLYPVPDALPGVSDKNLPPPPSHETGNRRSESISYGDLHQQLLEQYASPSLVVNEKYDVMHVSEGAARFLQMSGGEPSSNLLKLIRQELRLELRTALYQATQRKTNVEARGLQVHFGERTETINIHVRPVLRESDPSQGFLLVLFEPGIQAESDEERVFTSDEPVARQLEQELMRLKVELRTTTEQYELQAEELKASNEELQALNEELRSAAEELETSREELQSINEELTTVNQELKIKIEEVSQTSNNLQNLINSTDIATIFLDRSFRVHLFSPAARGIFNLLSSDIGRPLSDITHKLEYTILLEDAANVIEKLNTIEREVRTTEGRNFLMRLSPYRTSDDRIQGLVATFTDITERKRAEEAVAADLKATTLLRELSARLIAEGDTQMLYQEIMAAAITLMQADGGTFQVFDHETDELVILAAQGFDQNMTEHFHRVRAAPNSRYGRALTLNERMVVDFDVAENDDPDGSMRMHVEAGYLCAQSTPLVARHGKPIGMVTTHWRKQHRPGDRELRFLDLLARQAADLLERRQGDETLRESDRRKDEFLATLAHELRNPLAPIKNGLQIAQHTIPAGSPLKHTLKVMDRQLDHLVHLVDDLLDVARISSGKLQLRKQRVALREALASSIECIQPLIDRQKHELVADIGPGEVFVEGDFDRLSQVFSNLLSNAAKYTEPGGRIGISLAQEGNEAVVRVTDTGIGIDAEDLKHVFDLFSQVTSSRKLTEGGLGIGLSLIRTLVQLHGGTIAAESGGSKAGGSTFIVRLPLSHPDAISAPQPQSAPQPSPGQKKEMGPLRILVVDDNVDAALILAQLLEINGHEIEAVHRGKDAIEKARDNLPDIIFLDLGMPEMDGIETARHLRALPGGDGIFLVALTGWGQEKDRERTREAGFDAHLVKPVDTDVLVKMLERVKALK